MTSDINNPLVTQKKMVGRAIIFNAFNVFRVHSGHLNECGPAQGDTHLLPIHHFSAILKVEGQVNQCTAVCVQPVPKDVYQTDSILGYPMPTQNRSFWRRIHPGSLCTSSNANTRICDLHSFCLCSVGCSILSSPVLPLYDSKYCISVFTVCILS